MKSRIGILILAISLSTTLFAEVSKEDLNLTINPISQITGKLSPVLQDKELFTECLIAMAQDYKVSDQLLLDLFKDSYVNIISQASGNTVILVIVYTDFKYNLIQKSTDPNTLDFIDARLPSFLKSVTQNYVANVKHEAGISGINFSSTFAFERNKYVCQFNMKRNTFGAWIIDDITVIADNTQTKVKGRDYNQFYFLERAQNNSTGQFNTSSLLYVFFGSMPHSYTAANYF